VNSHGLADATAQPLRKALRCRSPANGTLATTKAGIRISLAQGVHPPAALAGKSAF
jgi:hypothetical protein